MSPGRWKNLGTAETRPSLSPPLALRSEEP